MTYLIAYLILSLTVCVLFGKAAHYGTPSSETPQPYQRKPHLAWRVIGGLLVVLLLNAAYHYAEAVERPRTAAECGMSPGSLVPPLAPCATYRARLEISKCNHDAACILQVKESMGIPQACASFYKYLEQ